MRQDKTVARILLMFFIANVVLAVPVLVRQRRLMAKDGTNDEPMGEPEHPATPPAGPETSPDIWSEDYLDEWAKSSENFPPNSPSGLHQGSIPSTGLFSEPNSASGLHQGSMSSTGHFSEPNTPSHGDLPPLSGPESSDPSHEGWLHSDWRLPATLEAYSSHEMFPPALEGHPFDDGLWLHELESIAVKDVDQASTMSWASDHPEWEEAAAKVAEETHIHP